MPGGWVWPRITAVEVATTNARRRFARAASSRHRKRGIASLGQCSEFAAHPQKCTTPVGIPNAQHSAVVGNTHIDRAADAVCKGDYFFLNVILRNGFQVDSFRLPECHPVRLSILHCPHSNHLLIMVVRVVRIDRTEVVEHGSGSQSTPQPWHKTRRSRYPISETSSSKDGSPAFTQVIYDSSASILTVFDLGYRLRRLFGVCKISGWELVKIRLVYIKENKSFQPLALQESPASFQPLSYQLP